MARRHDRIGVRPLAVTDADAHLAGRDEVIIERLGCGERASRSQIEAWLETNAHAWASGGEVVDLGIEDLGSGLLCGCVGVQRFDPSSPGCEFDVLRSRV